MGTAAVSVPNFVNGPSVQGRTVQPNYQAFMQKTQENAKRLGAFVPQVANPWSETVNYFIPKTGIGKKDLLWCTASFTIANGSGSTTVRDWLPWNIVKRVQLKGNGADVHSVSGMGLHVRKMRRNANPPLTGVLVNPGLYPGATPANGTYTAKFPIELPLCYSYENGVGAIYLEALQAIYEVVLTMASKSDMFILTGNADVTAFTFQLEPFHTWWTIPTDNVQGVGEVAYVPDLSRLFEIQEKTYPINSTGEFEAFLAQSNGNAMAVNFAFRNNGANVAMGAGGLDYIAWNYATNETPRAYKPTEGLLWENAVNYNGLLPANYACMDFERENPVRDAIRPRGVSDLNVTLGVPAATSLVNASMTMQQELLISAGNGPAVEVSTAPTATS